eukprot:tig00021105_g18271.t1
MNTALAAATATAAGAPATATEGSDAAAGAAGRKTFTLQTAPATELVMGSLMQDYDQVSGMSGLRGMFIGREATGKFFVSEIDLEGLRPVSFHWMEELGLPTPPRRFTPRIAFPGPVGPEETVALAAHPELLANATDEMRLVTGMEGLRQKNLTAGLPSSIADRFEGVKAGRGVASAIRERAAAGSSSSSLAGAALALDRVAARLDNATEALRTELMGTAMNFADLLLDPAVHGVVRRADGSHGYDPEVARQSAQRIVQQARAFTGQVRNVGAAALFGNMYFMHFYINPTKSRYGWYPLVLHADLLRYIDSSTIFSVSPLDPPPRGANFNNWETYQRKVLYHLKLDTVGCAIEEDYVSEYPSKQIPPGGYVDTIDAQYFAFEARGMAVFHSSIPKPACLYAGDGCPRLAAASELPLESVLRIAARLRGHADGGGLDYARAETVRMLYTGREDLDFAALRYANILAERTAAAAPLRANETALPPENSTASAYFTNSTGYYSYAGCVGTAFGLGACGGLAPSTTATTLSGYRGALDLASMEAEALAAATHVCCQFSPFSPPICMPAGNCPTTPDNMVVDIKHCSGCTGPSHSTHPTVCCLASWQDSFGGMYYKCALKSVCESKQGTIGHAIYCGGDDVASSSAAAAADDQREVLPI